MRLLLLAFVWAEHLSNCSPARKSFLQTKECHQCYTACSGKDEALNSCIEAYYVTCGSGKQILSACNCEQGGFDYPYLNPGGAPGGKFQWKCCFEHMCMVE